MMAKRGLSLTCVHFASPPYTSERARMKVLKLAKELTPYTGNLNVYVVPYTKPQEYIRDNAPDGPVHGADAPQHAAHRQHSVRKRAARTPLSPARAWPRWPARR